MPTAYDIVLSDPIISSIKNYPGGKTQTSRLKVFVTWFAKGVQMFKQEARYHKKTCQLKGN